MDRKLIIIASLFFCAELSVFLADLEVISIPFFTKSAPNSGKQEKIGEIISARNAVRRRAEESIIWEDSQSSDTLYVKDSILTLKRSSAKIVLKNNIQIELDENTLVVLEPPVNSEPDRLRLRFHRGLMASHSQDAIAVKAQEWSIEAKPNSDLSIRQGSDGQIAVEVARGEVALTSDKTQSQTTLAKGQRVELLQGEMGKIQQLSEELVWSSGEFIRIYAHQEPTTAKLAWSGHAERIQISSFNQASYEIPLSSEQRQLEMSLSYGLHVFQLHTSQESSRSLRVQVLPAPRLSYFTPLPRNRIKTSQLTPFSWLKHEQIDQYRIEVSKNLEYSTLLTQKNSSIGRVDLALSEQGMFFWRVIGIDADGFEIPAPFSYPIYSLENPLAPPQLAPPILDSPIERAPATPKDDKSSMLDQIFKWLWQNILPMASAQSTHEKTKKQNRVVFSWYPVPDADFYVLEVSESPDFVNLVFTTKTTATSYAWADYQMRVYYYRVAAGGDDGRMGLFSDFSVLDVNQLPVVKPATPAKQNISLKPEKKNIVPEPPPVVVADPPPPPEPMLPPPPPKLQPVDVSTRVQFIYSPYYRFSTDKAPDEVTASYAGANPLSLDMAIQQPNKEQGFWQLASHIDEREYKPEDSTLVGQKRFTEQHYKIEILHQKSAHHLPLGVWWKTSSTFERTGEESVRLKDLNFYGVQVHKQWSLPGDVRLSLQGHLGTGTYAFYAGSVVIADTTLPPMGQTLPFIGVQGDFNGWSDFSKRSSVASDLSLRLGFQW